MRKYGAILAIVLSAAPAAADDIAAGKALAEVNCARCHALDATGASPFADAPPFRSIHEMYDEGELEDAFNDGVPVNHPAMPDWEMTEDQARQLAAFIMSLGAPRP